MRREALEAGADVAGYVRKLMVDNPELVALRGKAKADYYTLDKVAGGLMRFYNAFPRHVVLNMQMATQPFEKLARHIAPGSASHSGIGITLVRGGAEDLVAALQAQLDEGEWAYVHVGDDSWVAAILEGVLVMFALDCTSFDLTQHGDVTQAVHDVLRDELALIDPTAADLWHTFARERLVVLVLSLAYKLRHAGPSGMPLQSKVNDMLMDVMINRVREVLKGHSEGAVAAAVEQVGREMGFQVRLEQYCAGWGVTEISEMLQRKPFLFIGYYFWANPAGRVMVHCDVPRTFSQIITPSMGWKRAKGEFELAEAMRLGSIAMNFGLAPPDLAGAFARFRKYASDFIERQLVVRGDVADPRLRWAVQENPFAAAVEPSLAGLLKVLQRPPELLWASLELPATVTFVPLNESWAEQMEREEELALAELGIDPRRAVRPAPAPAVLPIAFPDTRASTHPATSSNAGRPPPTAIWGPPRPPMRRAIRGTRERKERGGVVKYEDSDTQYTYELEEGSERGWLSDPEDARSWSTDPDGPEWNWR
jgi:hypothetical protein